MKCTLKGSNLISYCLFILFPLSAEDLLFAPTKSKQKIGAGTFGQQLVIRQFLKIVAVVICELIALTPKIAHRQREMICAILRQFFKTLKRFAIPHFTAC